MYPDGLIAVVKRDCPTCNLIVPALRQIAAAPPSFIVYTQDDPAFPDGLVGVLDDTNL